MQNKELTLVVGDYNPLHFPPLQKGQSMAQKMCLSRTANEVSWWKWTDTCTHIYYPQNFSHRVWARMYSTPGVGHQILPDCILKGKVNSDLLLSGTETSHIHTAAPTKSCQHKELRGKNPNYEKNQLGLKMKSGLNYGDTIFSKEN